MKDETWRRHANPCSVWTRFAAIPLLLLAIWSRDWIGWWCLAPLAAVVLWLVVNPGAFPAVDNPTSWSSRGIYGERIWLRQRDSLGAENRRVLRLLAIPGAAGIALVALGLIALDVWPTVFGATLVVLAQLWRIDRLVRVYDDTVQPAVPRFGRARE
jgi:hypothetical protein